MANTTAQGCLRSEKAGKAARKAGRDGWGPQGGMGLKSGGRGVQATGRRRPQATEGYRVKAIERVPLWPEASACFLRLPGPGKSGGYD